MVPIKADRSNILGVVPIGLRVPSPHRLVHQGRSSNYFFRRIESSGFLIFNLSLYSSRDQPRSFELIGFERDYYVLG